MNLLTLFGEDKLSRINQVYYSRFSAQTFNITNYLQQLKALLKVSKLEFSVWGREKLYKILKFNYVVKKRQPKLELRI